MDSCVNEGLTTNSWLTGHSCSAARSEICWHRKTCLIPVLLTLEGLMNLTAVLERMNDRQTLMCNKLHVVTVVKGESIWR